MEFSSDRMSFDLEFQYHHDKLMNGRTMNTIMKIQKKRRNQIIMRKEKDKNNV